MKPFRALMMMMMILILFFAAPLKAENPQPEPGKKLVSLKLPSPLDPAGRKVLGLNDKMADFKIAELKAELILMEVIGVYCPQCFKQAPDFNKLYERLNKGKMKGRVTMFALAAGGTDPEIEELIKSGQYIFPVVSDVKFESHKLLGEPKTPFTIICRPDGTVLYTHLGIITDIDSFYAEIKGFLSK
ncbi:MAG: hypothetical protein WC836_22140 [Desulfobacula sp.]|jgi:hypothetical protein